MTSNTTARDPASGDDWPELIPLEGGEVPALTPDMVSGWLGEFAEALADATETPVELAVGLSLGAVSAAAARRLRVEIKPDYSEPANLWIMPSLAPGNRKSAVEKATADPLRVWEREQAEALAPAIAAATAETDVIKDRAKEVKKKAGQVKDDIEARDLARQAAEIEQQVPNIPSPPQLWTSDATPENLGVRLAENDERMAWISAEGGFFETIGGRYTKGVPNLDLMLKAHSGDPERVDRIGRPPVYLTEPLLTVAMSPQPDLLRGLMAKPGFRGRGLLGRFLYFLPPSPLGFRTLDGPPLPESVKTAYASGLRAMLEWPRAVDADGQPRMHVVRLSRPAYEEWWAFAKSLEAKMRPGGQFEHMTDWAGKAPGAAARVALNLHAASHAFGRPWEVEIQLETMEQALAIVGVSAQHTRAVFGLMAANEDLAAAGHVWRWIERRRQTAFRARDVWQNLKNPGRFSKMADVMAALEHLAERGYLRIEEDVRGGAGRKPSPMVFVRPDLSEGWG
ncbi:MAG: YfjI family protein [Pseudomonadota bacterium]